MSHHIIILFLNTHFPDIEGCILFGSYSEKKEQAGDIDLLLVDNKFFHSSKENFNFNNKVFNVIKINSLDILNILAKHYHQGNLYYYILKEGIVICDKNNGLNFIKDFISNSYPAQNDKTIQSHLNETLFSLSELNITLHQDLADIEFYVIANQIILKLIDYFLIKHDHVHLKTNKIKVRYFNEHCPQEKNEIYELIENIQNNNPQGFQTVFNKIIDQYQISLNQKYSNHLILDDYSLPLFTCYTEKTLKFQEIKQLMIDFKKQFGKLNFYLYQIDAGQHEQEGCYIVFDNLKGYFITHKLNSILFLNRYFQNHILFPYNNIQAFDEIKFAGKQNERIQSEILKTMADDIAKNQKTPKEEYIFSCINQFIKYSQWSIYDIYHYYLMKMDVKNRSSNYSFQTTDKTEKQLIDSNQNNIKLLEQVIVKSINNRFNINLKSIKSMPTMVQIAILDRMISLFLSKDVEKWLYVYGMKNYLDHNREFVEWR